jgi:hypothetical protein
MSSVGTSESDWKTVSTPAVGDCLAGHEADQGALAGAVVADEADDLAVPKRE